MSRSRRVAVLHGGSSAEAEVSNVSAREVANALMSKGHQVQLISADGGVVQALIAANAEVVFPALHGSPGEDGTVQGMLEMLGLPYVGSAVEASAFAMNKIIAKHAFRAAALPVARDLVLEADADVSASVALIERELGAAVAVKPATQGSAIGVTLVRNPNQLAAAISLAQSFGTSVLVEQFIVGREITVGVLDLHGQHVQALPVIEIRTPTNTWYDYRHRYTAGESEHLIPAPLPADASVALQKFAVAAHTALGCRDLSRADFVYSEAIGPILLEVNTLPGMTPTSLYPDAARAIGLDFGTLMEKLIESAIARAEARRVRVG